MWGFVVVLVVPPLNLPVDVKVSVNSSLDIVSAMAIFEFGE